MRGIEMRRLGSQGVPKGEMVMKPREEINDLVRRIREGEKPRPRDGFGNPSNKREQWFKHPAFPGFSVRLTYTGQASWYIRHKTHGRPNKVKIGDVRYVDEKEAKKRAKDIWSKIQLDRLDPQAAKEEARKTAKLTFGVVVDHFLQSRNVRPRTAENYESHLKSGYYLKPFQGRPLDEITHWDIDSRMRAIKEIGGPGAAATTFWVLNTL